MPRRPSRARRVKQLTESFERAGFVWSRREHSHQANYKHDMCLMNTALGGDRVQRRCSVGRVNAVVDRCGDAATVQGAPRANEARRHTRMLNDRQDTSRNDTSRNDSRAAHICIAQVRNDTHTLVSHKRKATPCYRIPTPSGQRAASSRDSPPRWLRRHAARSTRPCPPATIGVAIDDDLAKTKIWPKPAEPFHTQ